MDWLAEHAVETAVQILRAGGLVAFPTDTVYGLASLPWDETIVGRLYEAKKRPADKPVPLLLSGADQVIRVASMPRHCSRLASRFWPGALTIVARKTESVPDAVSPGPTVGVRVPDHPFARRVIAAAGGVLAATSANLSGNPAPVTASEVVGQLGGRIELVLDGGVAAGGVPSTVLDCASCPPVLIRPGAVSADELRGVLGRLVILEED
jgi:L-threonylcarbamoyladenylate synthase